MLSVPVDRVRGSALAALGLYAEAGACFARALAGARQQSLLFEQLLIVREQAALAGLLGTAPSPEELCETGRLAQLLGLEPVAP